MSVALYLCMPLLVLLFRPYLQGVNLTSLAGLYAGLTILGYYVLFLHILLIAVFLIFAAWPPAAQVATGSCLTLSLFWLVIDGVLYRAVRLHVDPLWLSLATTSSRGLGISPWMLLLGLAVLAVLGFLVRFLLRVAKRVPHRGLLVTGAAALCLMAFAVSQVIHILAYERNDVGITSITPRLPFYYPIHSHREATKHAGLLLGIKETGTDPEAKAPSSLIYPLPAFSLADHQIARRPNILILLLESWRADSMNETVSPRIHRLAQRSSVFENHFSSGNSTTAGFFSIFYGIHPTYWTAVKANAAQIDNPVLIDMLETNGYTFGIFADSDFDRHKIKDTMFRRIDVHEEFDGSTPDAMDRDLNSRLLAFALDAHRAGRPFFGLAFYKSTHFNYHYPKDGARFAPAHKLNIINPGGKRDREAYFNDYRNAVYYDDQLIGDLLDGLETAGVQENTIVVITTDHGEEFDDNHAGYWGHVGNFTGYQIRVPLVIYVPWKEPRLVTEVTSHVDIPPTLMHEGLGCDVETQSYSNGYDLFGPLPSERPIIVSSYINYAVVTGEDVSVVYPMYVQRYKLWDVKARTAGPRPDLARRAVDEMGRFYRLATEPYP